MQIEYLYYLKIQLPTNKVIETGSTMMVDPPDHDPESLDKVTELDHDPESLDKVAELLQTTEKRGPGNGDEKIEGVATPVQLPDFVQHRDKASELRQRKSSNLRLSVVSKKYDLDNTGVLDEHEKELRAMDQGKKMRSPQVVVVISRCLNRFHQYYLLHRRWP